MNRIASLLTGLSFAVLFFVTSAHAQSNSQKLSANIPFAFTVGSISLPAGQYEFARTGAGANIVQVRDINGRTQFTLPSASVQGNSLPEKSGLKFVIVDGRHVLIQIWNEHTGSGTEFTYERTPLESAEHKRVAEL